MFAKTPTHVREDFDRIALASPDSGDHGGAHQDFLLSLLPSPCRRALEVGCGTGAFARALARRAEHVLGIDLSPNMIRVAREKSDGVANLEFEIADVLERMFPAEHFDCVVAIAALHHVPWEAALLRLRDALASPGVLLVLDLFAPASPGDYAAHLISYPYAFWRRVRAGTVIPEPRVRKLWSEHGSRDTYPRLGELRSLCRKHLPGARIERRLPWRFSLVWRKP